MQKLILTLFTFGILLFSTAAFAQYDKHPLDGKQWFNISGGLNSADNLSWQGMGSFSRRSDYIMTTARIAYSQELIEGIADSIYYRKNRLGEIGVMWGDGYAGRHWYVSGSAGFGLNFRMYGDSAEQNDFEFRYLTAVTIGIPAQIEAGILFNENWGINTTIVGNWNFRQAYYGIHLGVIYRFKYEDGE